MERKLYGVYNAVDSDCWRRIESTSSSEDHCHSTTARIMYRDVIQRMTAVRPFWFSHAGGAWSICHASVQFPKNTSVRIIVCNHDERVF